MSFLFISPDRLRVVAPLLGPSCVTQKENQKKKENENKKKTHKILGTRRARKLIVPMISLGHFLRAVCFRSRSTNQTKGRLLVVYSPGIFTDILLVVFGNPLNFHASNLKGIHLVQMFNKFEAQLILTIILKKMNFRRA